MLLEGMKALVCGLGIVFIVLISIAIVIALLKYLPNKEAKKQQDKPVDLAKHFEVPAVLESTQEVIPQQDDSELVAVITAAISASLNTSADQLMITSYRRIRTNSTWNN